MTRKIYGVITLNILIIITAFLSSCTNQTSPNTKTLLQGATMGTQYNITLITPATDNKKIDHPVNSLNFDKIQRDINSLLKSINKDMSTYDANSSISLFNRTNNTHWFSISADLFNVISTAQQISQLSNGSFDITAATLVNLWGFGPDIHYQIPTQQAIDSALKSTGYHLLEIKQKPSAIRKLTPTLTIDLSAIAKGFAVDKIAALLDKYNINNYLVEIGGEIIAKGHNQQNKPWKISIERPSPSLNQAQQSSLNIDQSALATSGDYRNFFKKEGKRYSHTINPKTGKPVTHHLASVTVLDKTAMRADALATALMVMGEKRAQQFVQKHAIQAFFIIREVSSKNKPEKYRTWTNISALKTKR